MPLSFQMVTASSVLIIQPHYIMQNDIITLWRPHVRDNNDNTFEWVDGKNLSEVPHGKLFKNGIAMGYDTLIDLANGYDVDPRVMYTAFELCENHAIHLAKGRLQKQTKGLNKTY